MKTKTAHTPLKTTDPLSLTYGNSKNGKIFNSWRIYNREGAKLRTVATMESEQLSPEREHELSRLFCAAPELLAALDELLTSYVSLVNSGDAGSWNPETDAEVKAARAAIAKATGGAL